MRSVGAGRAGWAARIGLGRARLGGRLLRFLRRLRPRVARVHRGAEAPAGDVDDAVARLFHEIREGRTFGRVEGREDERRDFAAEIRRWAADADADATEVAAARVLHDRAQAVVARVAAAVLEADLP